MRAKTLLLVLALLAACSPPAQTSTGKSASASAPATVAGQHLDPAAQALAAVVATAVSDEIGQPVSLRVTTATVQDTWGWVIAQPRTPTDGAINWRQTRYAARAEAGDLDGDGTTYALLQQQNGQWVVRQFVIGPQDVAYNDWPQRYGAPAALMGLQDQPATPAKP